MQRINLFLIAIKIYLYYQEFAFPVTTNGDNECYFWKNRSRKMRKDALSRVNIRLDWHRYWLEGIVPANNNKQKCLGTKLQPVLLYCICRGNFGKDRCEQLMASTIHFQKMLHWENSLVLSRWKAKGRFSTFLMLHGVALHLLQNMSEDGQRFTTSFLTYGNICICVQFPSYFISETNSLKWSK